tara:strand:- start:517 stop:1458 length:942 start_codon:yes stop_codon:yes gene_type:complete
MIKVFLPGGAGLVGINLIASIKSTNPEWKIVVVDKKKEAIEVAKSLFPDVCFICEDLTITYNQKWPIEIRECNICIMLQAEIGTTNKKLFELNNVISTKVILKQLKKNSINRIIHISSSVVCSNSFDNYTKSKIEQEQIILKEFPNSVVLRPTLMFGWFDRKHLGWLANFMIKSPFFPIPGKGDFTRQPLYVGDFCGIIKNCIKDKSIRGIYSITGLTKIKYIDLMKILRKTKSAKTIFVFLPFNIFNFLLNIWALISRKPAFTSDQLNSLIAGDQFEVIDWPNIFKIKPTKLKNALEITYKDPKYSKIKIPF